MGQITSGNVAVTLLAVLLLGASSQSPASELQARERCDHFTSTKRPFFGDLHVHTRYSLDASTQGTQTTPAQAYQFAQGGRIGVQPWSADGKAQRSLQLARPLDFAMVSDHAELIGEVEMCNNPEVTGHNSWQCRFYRAWPRGAFYLFNYMAAMRASHLGLCGDCLLYTSPSPRD